ncbi:adenosine deaminase [Nonomuraea sp. NPDC050310]|uniref:adenosine deaminase n=1 Tax=Nonomuraea sp. NPDC050310 TaxID=3154935 RepID=UPI0033F38D6F
MIPKAHLHTHLESTIRPRTIAELSGGAIAEPAGPAETRFADFRDFADQRAKVRELLTEPAHFRRIAVEFCQDEAAQGVRYAEVTFTAASHGERVGALEMPLESVLEGLEEGRQRYGLETRVILDHSRRRPVERLRRTVELAARYEQVVAVGLAGDERHSLKPFAGVLREARDLGLHLVHHAGESAGAESVREALEVGMAERIGHGIRVLDDPALVAEVRERGVPLEVCPTSNVMLSLVGSMAEHPLARLVEAGLVVTLNTDGETSLGGEYRVAAEVFGLDVGELARASVRASFAPAAVKERVLAEIAGYRSS